MVSVSERLDARGLGLAGLTRRGAAAGAPDACGELDLAAVVLASRRAGEPWFLLEQPDRGCVVASLGAVAEVAADDWAAVAAHAHADAPGTPAGSGLIVTGGRSFTGSVAAEGRWGAFGGASLSVPRIAFARDRGETWITVNAVAGEDAAAVLERLRGLRAVPSPDAGRTHPGTVTVDSILPEAHYEQAVAAAVARIRAGEMQKVVLAREVAVHAESQHDAAAIFATLRERFPSCFLYCVGRGAQVYIGASPELLIRKDGMRASTVSLAGTIPRSADPETDERLAHELLSSAKNRHENEIVADRIERALKRYALWVQLAEEPVLVKVANVQHLGVPIRAQLTSPVSVFELVRALHPTPAVGGEPTAAALAAIAALEGFDRGWYAAPVGWADLAGDGEFCVALRGALLDGADAYCYAGCGIVADSDPASELAETHAKLEALLPVLTASGVGKEMCRGDAFPSPHR